MARYERQHGQNGRIAERVSEDTMERIKKLKDEAEKQSQQLLKEKQQLLAQNQRIQQRVNQIDISIVALAGKVEGFNQLLEPQEPKKVIPKKKK